MLRIQSHQKLCPFSLADHIQNQGQIDMIKWKTILRAEVVTDKTLLNPFWGGILHCSGTRPSGQIEGFMSYHQRLLSGTIPAGVHQRIQMGPGEI